VTRFNTKAIVIGSMLMFILDILTGSLLFSIFGGDSLTSGATQAEIEAVGAIIDQNDSYLLASLLLGTFSTVLGGYVAARIAKRLPLFNACAVGWFGIFLGILLGGSGDSPWWFNAIGYISTIPMAIVGGLLARTSMK